MGFLLAALICSPEASITEVMANPLDEDTGEFVEICNTSLLPLDLLGFTITDGDELDDVLAWTGAFPDTGCVTGTTIVPPGGYAVLLDIGYAAAPAYDFPAGTVILSTGDASICNGLAAASDPMTLYGPGGTADSNVVSTYGTPVPSDSWSSRDDDGLDGIPFDPGDGISVERVIPVLPDEEDNWIPGPPGGTPGGPRQGSEGVDLACLSVMASPPRPAPGLPFEAEAVFMNLGTQTCVSGQLLLFVDLDADSIPDSQEQVVASADASGLAPGIPDTLTASIILPQGWFCVTGLADSPQDTTGSNDAGAALAAPGDGIPPVVTEVMANPLDEDAGEYVEIWYPGPGAWPACACQFTDGDAVDGIDPWQGELPDPDALSSGWLPSGRVLVVLDPEYVPGGAPYDLPESTFVASPSNTALGNGLTADDPVVLYGPWGTSVQDILSTYGTPVLSDDPLSCDDDGLDGIPFDPGNGNAVERIYPLGPDAEFDWAPTGPGGTPGTLPGTADSLDVCIASLVPSVPGGDSLLVLLTCVILNCGGTSSPSFQAVFFDDLDADSAASPGEIQSLQPVQPLLPGQSDTVSAIAAVPQEGCWLLGVVADLPGDVDLSDNTALEGYSTGDCPAPVLTEILANPADEDRDEYVEIHFPGPGVWDSQGCSITDGDALDILVQWPAAAGPLSDPDAHPARFLPAGGWAVVLDPEYASGAQPWDFAPGTGVLSVQNTTLGDGLSGTDPVILYGPGGTLAGDILSTWGTPLIGDDPLGCDDDGLDSIPFDPGQGLAVHRIDVAGPDAEGNWAASDPTPGGPAEGLTPGVDMAAVLLEPEPPMGEDGWVVGLEAALVNLGTAQASPGELRVTVYADLDWSGTPSTSEIIHMSYPDPPAPGDTVAISTVWTGVDQSVPLVLAASCAPDTTLDDDTLAVIWNRPFDMVLNEIMYHPSPGEPEWVELHNVSDQPVQIHGLRLSDSHETVTVTGDSLLVPPGGFVVVTSDSAAFVEAWPGAPGPLLEPSSWPALNDQTQPGQSYADDIRLSLPGGQTIDMVPYDDSWGGGTGSSLEKIDPVMRGWLPASWATCASGGTPGTVNTAYDPGGPGGAPLSWWPDPFSPDGDGADDVLSIRVELPQHAPGRVTVEIYNVQGRLVRTVADRQQCGGTALFTWDGTDDSGGRLFVGRYIVYARLEPDDGDVREHAGVVILARRLGLAAD